jgi:Fe-Mn family superoxide dismutase
MMTESALVNQSRRNFLLLSGAAGALAFADVLGLSKSAMAAQATLTSSTNAISTMPTTGVGFELMKLPYADNALDPVISINTMSFHYGKHHAGYVTNLNGFIKGTAFEGKSLEAIIKKTHNQFMQVQIYNNAAQVWNHNFYWNSLKPNSGDATPPTGQLLALIEKQFGHFSDATKNDEGAWTNPGFKQKLHDVARTHFASGWAWVVYNKKTKQLELVSTKNADTPITKVGMVPLLVIDVWEHAYYLDYQNKRADYLTGVLDKLANWSFAEENLASVL